jgi:putative phosphoesterase
MPTIAILSDTHMPRGNRALPLGAIELLQQADHIIHAGDFAAKSVLDELKRYGKPLTAVHGNVDDAELKELLPQTTTLTIDRSKTIAVTHDAGPAKGRLNRLRRRFPDADAVVFGHSHLPLHEQAPDGFQIFNPGSPTERRRAPHKTMGLARVDAQAISFELVILG